MDVTHVLIAERMDRNSHSEGAHHLLFHDAAGAQEFARKLASDYYGCGELPIEGNFETPLVKGDVFYDQDQMIISWIKQSKTPGGSIGDTHCLTVEPIGIHNPLTRLDFWNN